MYISLGRGAQEQAAVIIKVDRKKALQAAWEAVSVMFHLSPEPD